MTKTISAVTAVIVTIAMAGAASAASETTDTTSATETSQAGEGVYYEGAQKDASARYSSGYVAGAAVADVTVDRGDYYEGAIRN